MPLNRVLLNNKNIFNAYNYSVCYTAGFAIRNAAKISYLCGGADEVGQLLQLCVITSPFIITD